MEQAYEPNRPDVIAMRRRAEGHAKRAVRIGVLGLLVALPVAAEPFATPFVALAAVLLILASGDLAQSRYRHGRKRLLFGAVMVIVAMLAWIPRTIEGEEVSSLLLAGPVSLVVLAFASLSAAWARQQSTMAMETEAQRARIRQQRAVQDGRGKAHELPGSLTMAEIKANAAETGGRATIRATAWKGTPDNVNLEHERFRGASPAQRAARKETGDPQGSFGTPPPASD